MNSKETQREDLFLFSLRFIDEKMEKKYLEKIYKLRWLLISFGIFTFLISILNLILLLFITNITKDIFNFVITFVLIGLNCIAIISNFNAKKFITYFTSIYFQLFLFSFNLFLFGNQLRIMNELQFFTVYKTEEFILIKDFLIFFIDFFVRLVVALTPFNNFIFFLTSNILTIIIYFFIFQFNSFFSQNLTITFYISFSLALLLFSLVSRINMKNTKTIFLYKEIIELSVQTNKNYEDLIKNMNTGYITKNNEKIIDKNNFFQREKEFFNFLIKDYENMIKITDDQEAGSDAENFSQSKAVLLKDLKESDFQKILKIIFSNIKFYNEDIIVQGTALDFSSRSPKKTLRKSKTKEYNRTLSLKSDPNYITIPDNSIHQLDIELGHSRLHESKFERQNSMFSKKDFSKNIYNYIITNKEKFKNFEYLGKSVIIKGADKILSLEIFCKVSEDESIEFLFNDLTKTELYNGSMQFMIKTGQFLHDFKNPLICIFNEIGELKEQNENMMYMIYEHMQFLVTKNIESNLNFDLADCEIFLEKFEYIKQMSEYCQNMIGSYEDFSKGIFKPQAINLSIEKFDLIEMLRFLENMMNFKMSYSNKNVEFKLDLENLTSRSKPSLNKNSSNSNEAEEIKLIIASDEAKLKRVLINVLSNSEKFTTRGEIILSVTKETINDKRYIKFKIEDTGIGMDSNILQKLFTPFFSNNSTEVNKNGCGLGLIIVKEITEKLGIGIKIFSDVGKGTTSVFYVEDRSFSNLEKMNTYDFENNSNKSYYGLDRTRTINLKNQIFNNDKIKGMKQIIDNLDDSDIQEIIYNKPITTTKDKYYSQKSRRKSVLLSKPLTKFLSRKSMDSGNGNIANRSGMINIFNSFTTNSSFIVENKNRYTPLIIVNVSNFSLKSETSNYAKTLFTNLTTKNFKLSGKNLNTMSGKLSYRLKHALSNKRRHKFSAPDTNSSDNFSLKTNSLMNKETYEKTTTTNSDSTSIENIKISKNKGTNVKSKFANLPRYNSVNSARSKNIYVDENERLDKEINILIIDNEQSIRSFCKNSIYKITQSKNINITIDEADDGLTGLAQILMKIFYSKGIYDLIITDDRMTYLDGSDMVGVLEYLSSSKMVRYKIDENILKKILICSSDSQNVKYKTKNSNIIRVCEKPLNQEVLTKLINNII